MLYAICYKTKYTLKDSNFFTDDNDLTGKLAKYLGADKPDVGGKNEKL